MGSDWNRDDGTALVRGDEAVQADVTTRNNEVDQADEAARYDESGQTGKTARGDEVPQSDDVGPEVAVGMSKLTHGQPDWESM